MPLAEVRVTGHVLSSPEAAWAVVSDFCRGWHPAIASVAAERDERGALVRAFAVHGEDTIYRERLTYFSASDRVLAYTHLEGIAGVEAYDASIAVAACADGGATVEWSATVEAEEPRLGAICAGTRAVFEAGIAALAGEAKRARPHASGGPPPLDPPPLAELAVEGASRLALSATPAREGPLCLFLHGIGGARWNWRPQVEAAGEVMRAAALDLRGYGDSAMGDAQSTVEDHCADILRVRDALGADRLVLVGLSYGAWLATSFAMRYPELLAGLVLSGGCTGMSEAGPEEREAFRASREAPLDAGRTPADFAPAVVPLLAGPNASDEVRSVLLRSMAAIPAAAYRDALVCFTNPPGRFDFSRLGMPVLMMTGEHDRLATPAEIRAVAGRILALSRRPDVRYETIADAGHVCNLEQPDAYGRTLLEFLARLPR